MPQVATVNVVQITDLQILSDDAGVIYGAEPYAALDAVLCAVDALPQRPSVLIATGDLSEDGSAASYGRLREALLGTRIPTLVLPGNHDAVNEIHASLLGGDVQMPSTFDLGPWRLVLLDSSIHTSSHGGLSARQVARLSTTLAASVDRHVLVCLHRSPSAYCPSPGCRLDDAETLLQLLDSAPCARGLMSGHGHGGTMARGRPEAGSTLLFEPAHGGLGFFEQARA